MKRCIYSPDCAAKRTKDALANEARILNYQVNKLDFTSPWHEFETVMAPKDVRNGILNSAKIREWSKSGEQSNQIYCLDRQTESVVRQRRTLIEHVLTS